jgi:catechol 2,3-dioxygenase-like lactoylglutathione lyase family enzyme
MFGIHRREFIILFGGAAAWPVAARAQQQAGIFKPAMLDHVNIRASNSARSAEFYAGLFDTPVLRNPAMRVRPTAQPGEAFFFKLGDGYLVISQASPMDTLDLDHYSVGSNDYKQAGLMADLRDNGITGEVQSRDVWVPDPDGNYLQLRTPGGWARQTATPYAGFVRAGAALSPLSMRSIGIRCTDLARAGHFYGRLFGTEIASAASSASRAFAMGDSVLTLIAAPSGPALNHIRIAVKDFTINETTRVLRGRKIDPEAVSGSSVRVADPDGIPIEIAAGS